LGPEQAVGGLVDRPHPPAGQEADNGEAAREKLAHLEVEEVVTTGSRGGRSARGKADRGQVRPLLRGLLPRRAPPRFVRLASLGMRCLHLQTARDSPAESRTRRVEAATSPGAPGSVLYSEGG